MPNTLAHIAVGRLALIGCKNQSDILLVYIGCVIPDFPWIMQRVIRFLLDVNFLDLRLYSIAQASLVMCLILSLCIALFFRDVMRAALLLSLGALIHLLLDATQAKWANGVHLFAPFDWTLINWGWYWPESAITYLLTVAGFCLLLISMKSMLVTAVPLKITVKRLLLSLPVFLAYCLLPLLFMSAIERSGSHYVDVLRNQEARVGKLIEIDRGRMVVKEGSVNAIRVFSGDEFELKGIPFQPSGSYSIKGVFIDKNTIKASHYRAHKESFRDGATVIGLSLLLVIIMVVLFRARPA